MVEKPKSCYNGSSATKPLSLYDMWNAQRLSPCRDTKVSIGVRRKCMAWVKIP